MKNIIIILLAIVSISCSPQRRLNWKIDRAEIFARKHDLIIVDTIWIPDTTFIERQVVRNDSIFIYNDTTIVINNDRVRVEYYYDSITNNIYHEVEVKEIEIIKEIPVEVEKIKYLKQTNWVLIFCLLLALFFIILIALRFIKNNRLEKANNNRGQ